MKQVTIIIRPNRYVQTKARLLQAGFGAMSVKEITGRGKKRADYEAVKAAQSGNAVGMEFVAKKMIDIYVTDQDVDALVQAVLEVNSSGNAGDGKIFIAPVDEIHRIRTQQKNDEAIY